MEAEIQFYNQFIGKTVRVHTERLDTIEGVWEAHLVTPDKDGENILVWWVRIRNSKRVFYILAEIDVIEVLN